MNRKTLITHPSSFIKRYRKKDQSPVGLSLSMDQISHSFDVQTSSKPLRISQDLFFLGEIPRENSFEAKKTSFCDETGNDDFIPDDSALVLVNKNGLTIISGCAHSGICNICEYAVKVTGVSTIHTVVGGFHLKSNDEQTKQTIKYFQKKKISRILPSHCTELPALSAFHQAFNIGQIKTGQQLLLD